MKKIFKILFSNDLVCGRIGEPNANEFHWVFSWKLLYFPYFSSFMLRFYYFKIIIHEFVNLRDSQVLFKYVVDFYFYGMISCFLKNSVLIVEKIFKKSPFMVHYVILALQYDFKKKLNCNECFLKLKIILRHSWPVKNLKS